MNTRAYWFDFHLACLFFDSVLVPAAAMLSNPRLRALWRSSQSTAASAYSTGLIRPIVMNAQGSLATVANSMLAHGTVNRLSSDRELLTHAQEIERATFKPLLMDETAFRAAYATAFERAVERLRDIQLRADGADLHAITVLHRWAEDRARSSQLRATEVHRFIDAHGRMAPDLRARVKMLADLVFHETCRGMLRCCLIVGDAQLDLVPTLEPLRDEAEMDEQHCALEPIKCWVPFERLAQLPLEDVLALRAETPFVDLRHALGRVRLRERAAIAMLESDLAKCLSLLIDYTKAPAGLARRLVLKKTPGPLPIVCLYMLSVAGQQVAVQWKAPNLSTRRKWLLACVNTGYVGAAYLLGRFDRSRQDRYVLPEGAQGDVLVDLRTGSRSDSMEPASVR